MSNEIEQSRLGLILTFTLHYLNMIDIIENNSQRPIIGKLIERH